MPPVIGSVPNRPGPRGVRCSRPKSGAPQPNCRKVRAFASIVFDDCFIINDLRVIEGRSGQLFVSMPSRKVRSGQMRDIAHPLNSDTRRQIEERVLAEFEQAVANLVVPSTAMRGKKDGRSTLDRLAAKLFAEDYWTSEPNREVLDLEESD